MSREEKSAALGELYSRYPTILAQDFSLTRFSWQRSVGVCPVLLHLQCNSFPSSRHLKLVGDTQTLFILGQAGISLESVVESADTVVEVVAGLDRLLEEVERCSPQLGRSGDALQVDTAVLTEISRAGWENVVGLSSDLRTVTVAWRHPEQEEKVGERHEVRVQFPPGWQQTGLVVQHELPDCWVAPATPSLNTLLTAWQQAVANFQPVWAELRELDRLCRVLEPIPPRPAHLHRRLAVCPASSLLLTLDPAAPRSLPHIRFLGADCSLGPLREALGEHQSWWDETDPVLTNLERVLGVELPGRAESGQQEEVEEGGECGICYAETLEDGEMPTRRCEEPRCGRGYHEDCLYRWLVSLPTCRATLDTAHGECPYCRQPIRCTKPAGFH